MSALEQYLAYYRTGYNICPVCCHSKEDHTLIRLKEGTLIICPLPFSSGS